MSRKNKQKKTPELLGDRDSYSHPPAGATTATVASHPDSKLTAERGKKPSEATWLETVWKRSSRWLGSLQVAVLLLSLFAAVLAIGTVVESWYSDKVAKDLVYRTWWFNLLLFFLGVNIFFAAAKKWPWKKYQTGFLITHLGLLTMVSGGLLTGLFGTDTTMALLATSNPQMQEREGLPQQDHFVTDRETATIRVRELDRNGQDRLLSEFPIQPGSLAWRSDEHFRPNLHPLLIALAWLEHPLPRFWSAAIDNTASIEVLNYYPHVRRERFRPIGDAEESSSRGVATFPAVKIFLSSSLPVMKQLDPEIWVAGRRQAASHSLAGIGAVELLGRCPADLADEFLRPAPVADEKGELVLRLGGSTLRLPISRMLGQPPQPIGNSGWKAQISRFEAEMGGDSGHAHGQDSGPVLMFALTGPNGQTTECGLFGRLPGQFSPLRGDAKLPALSVWYQAADPRLDKRTMQSLLQFAVIEHERGSELYYRAFSSESGKFQLEKAGPASADDTSHSIWAKTANWKFRVLEFLPRATSEPWFIPEDRRPGLEDFVRRPALRCQLHVGSQTKEFWVARDAPYSLSPEANTVQVSVGGREFLINFADNKSDLGFEIKLLRAETLFDPGTNSQAGYTSWVQVSDPAAKIKEDRMVTMNEPLEYRGYKFFQSGLNPAGAEEETLKPVSNSIFTVSRDPGLWMKYLGSTMLALGIACMFYMKAYFFKPRGRRGTEALT
jgi:hypothetical protein